MNITPNTPLLSSHVHYAPVIHHPPHPSMMDQLAEELKSDSYQQNVNLEQAGAVADPAAHRREMANALTKIDVNALLQGADPAEPFQFGESGKFTIRLVERGGKDTITVNQEGRSSSWCQRAFDAISDFFVRLVNCRQLDKWWLSDTQFIHRTLSDQLQQQRREGLVQLPLQELNRGVLSTNQPASTLPVASGTAPQVQCRTSTRQAKQEKVVAGVLEQVALHGLESALKAARDKEGISTKVLADFNLLIAELRDKEKGTKLIKALNDHYRLDYVVSNTLVNRLIGRTDFNAVYRDFLHEAHEVCKRASPKGTDGNNQLFINQIADPTSSTAM